MQPVAPTKRGSSLSHWERKGSEAEACAGCLRVSRSVSSNPDKGNTEEFWTLLRAPRYLGGSALSFPLNLPSDAMDLLPTVPICLGEPHLGTAHPRHPQPSHLGLQWPCALWEVLGRPWVSFPFWVGTTGTCTGNTSATHNTSQATPSRSSCSCLSPRQPRPWHFRF